MTGVGLPEPKITVSLSEYMSEVRYFRTLRDERRRLYRLWGRYASLWRWYRRPEDLARLREVISKIFANRRKEREAREVFRRKIKAPYWRIGVAYMFRKETKRPPYLFYAEFRKTVYTRKPEKYAVWNPSTREFDKPKPWLEEELREIMFASSLISRRTKSGEIAHGEWIEALSKLKVYPFPDFEAAAIDKREVEAPLDTEQYYVRIQKGTKEVYEYRTEEVEGWLRTYRLWLMEAAKRGYIRYPDRWRRVVRQTSLDDFARWWEEHKRKEEE